MSSTFGSAFRITTWGESHGPGIGVVIDGCPPRVPLTAGMVQAELDRRRPGQSDIVTPRQEADRVEILSGVLDGLTLGTPIALSVRNKDQRSSAYDEMQHCYRPSHADFCYDAKYGIRAWAGGGRASARETIGRVAAGAVARAVVQTLCPQVDVLGWVKQVGPHSCPTAPEDVRRDIVEANAVRAADPDCAREMEACIRQIRSEGDSIGGIVACTIRNCPVGLGDPVFDKLEATLAHAMMSIPACRGFAVGSGFAAAGMRGSQHNDPYYMEGERVRTRSNRSGGIQGGISNGEDIDFELAFKPTATLMLDQETVTDRHEPAVLRGKGRHDACVLPRAVPVVEAMAWMVLCDHLLRQQAIAAWRG